MDFNGTSRMIRESEDLPDDKDGKRCFIPSARKDEVKQGAILEVCHRL